jgi:hypothetical protein
MNGSNGSSGKFYGKYRGVVVSNIDPQQLGRLMVKVPDVLGEDPCFWAMPASPVAGPQMGIYAVPPVNAGVWVEFEQGDPNYPIWSGSSRGSVAETPAMALAAPPSSPPIVIQSQAQNRIIVSSVPGDGIRLETAAGPAGPNILISPAGIVLSDGKGGMISIAGGTVMINRGAPTILP